MKLNEHERARPNLAGLVSSGQQAEMKLLLAGNWPPLKPLPVFKYESTTYRASIEFDKTRGEWVCRKTFLPSNNVQEVRGGLAEVARSLPDSPAGAFAESPRTQQQKQEFDREACRRLQTILEWKVNFENGALYSDLQNYLSESQQQEIDDILRLTLTARQLQFSPKNVACVFDALSKAGGRLGTLLEIARRNKAQQAVDPAAEEETSAPGAVLQSPVPTFIPVVTENSPEEQMGSVFSEQDQSRSPEPAVHTEPQANEIAPQKIPEVNPSSFGEDRRKEVHERAPVAGVRPQIFARKLESPANRVLNPPSRQRALEISGRHIAAFAVVFLFAVISLPIGLTVGRGPLGQWFRDAQQSLFSANGAPPASPAHPVETTSRSAALPSPLPVADSDNSGTTTSHAVAPPDEKSGKGARDFESSAKSPPTISNGSNGLIARVSPPVASSKPAHPFSAADTARGAWRNPAPLRVAPSIGASPRRSTPAGILVTPPAHGSKPFRVSFPEKTIAASSSIAMASELSVLVPPDLGPEAAPKSSRLQAGELVSFVWPRYSRQRDRYGAAEIVRVRATVGQLGQVLDIKLLSGSAALFLATTNAIRQWHYKPTLLNKKPIPVQHDITIEFRPPQYLSQARTRHPAHN